jgi:hypothetical protein
MDPIPLAIPYPWTVSEPQASPRPTKKRQGSGFTYLERCNWSDLPNVKRIRTLLKLPELVSSSSSSSSYCHQEIQNSLPSSIFFSSPSVPCEDPNDDKSHVTEDNDDYTNKTPKAPSSLFLHLLQQVDQIGDGSRSAKELIQSCALTVRPQSTPGNMDAKAVILAALTFLTSSRQQLLDVSWHDNDDNDATTLQLPLLKIDEEPSSNISDPEQVVYRKAWTWKWTDFRTSQPMRELQFIWDSSPLRREVYVPRFFLSDPEETALLQSGVVPASAVAAASKRNNKTPLQPLLRRKLPLSMMYSPND